jgi:hypothetical protein
VTQRLVSQANLDFLHDDFGARRPGFNVVEAPSNWWTPLLSSGGSGLNTINPLLAVTNCHRGMAGLAGGDAVKDVQSNEGGFRAAQRSVVPGLSPRGRRGGPSTSTVIRTPRVVLTLGAVL